MRWDIVVSVASWLIVVALLISTVGLWADPPTGYGPVAKALGVFGSQVTYTALYVVEAVVLAYSKLGPTDPAKRLRRGVLLTIFFTGAFTSTLTLTIVGFSWALVDNMALWILAGICYLYWQIKTRYVTDEELEQILAAED